jgi:asparagine synthase (glutamine-hydrolysing)
MGDGAARVGLPLSGGLDSRTLLAAAGPRRLTTLTYGQRGADDLELAARLAAAAGTEHHEIPLDPGYIAAEARTMVARTDGMHSCLNAHAALLRAAGRWCDVILLGNGGDCLLDGLWHGAPDAGAAEMAARLLPKIALGMSPDLAADVAAPRGPLADAGRRAHEWLRALLDASDGDSAPDRADAFNVVHRHRRWVLQGVPAQATHVDFRHPYYDDDVVAAALAVPAALRTERRAHVAALARLSPALARVRRQGRPFGFDVTPWRWRLHLASGRVRDAVRWRANRAGLNPFLARPHRGSFADYDDELRHGSRALLDEVACAPATLERGWFRPDAVRRLVDEHLAGRANRAAPLGVLLTLELFAREQLDAVPRPWRALCAREGTPGPDVPDRFEAAQLSARRG